MHLVTFTNLYPSDDMPRHGIFVQERLRHLIGARGLSATVVALRPTFGGRGGTTHESSSQQTDIAVTYQRVPTVPKLSNWIDPWVWANAAEDAVKAASVGHERDSIIDAHFLYPDGVAATILGRRLGLPVVMTARGSDVNVKCENPIMRRWVRWAAARSEALITVSEDLASKLVAFGVTSPILKVVPNGVDLKAFRPLNSAECKERLGIAGKVVASVGHLIEDKGHMIVVQALAGLPDTTLLVVGEGPDEAKLKALAANLGIADRVRFLGLVPHAEMLHVYSAADALVLLSAREGMPNVVLESLACGTRVVANDVGGVSEVVRNRVAGVVVKERSVSALRAGLTALDRTPTSVASTREYATQFDWSGILPHQVAVYRQALGIG